MTDTLTLSKETLHELYESSSVITLKDYLGLTALFLSAIVAVLVGQWLQDRKAKKDRQYQNRFNIFATILGLRHVKHGDEQFVIAINQIPIVFHENEKVLQKLERFIKTHADRNIPQDKVHESLNSDLNDLVLEMAKVLDYKNIDNNVMKTFYNPDASHYRSLSNIVYSELYTLQNLPNLHEARKSMAPSPNDQPSQPTGD